MTHIIPRDKILSFVENDKVGNYTIISQNKRESDQRLMPLGEGGSGVVYLAEQFLTPGVKIKRALKFFIYRDDIAQYSVHKNTGQISASTFKDELVNISNVNHENIIKIIEANLWNSSYGIDVPYVVTEYIDGATLQNIIDTKSLEEALKTDPYIVIELITQIARGIKYLHDRSFYHYDIAPKNIFVEGASPNYRIIIGDLGLGKKLPLVDRANQFVAGTRDYCPDNVVSVLNKYVPAEEFEKYQPAWDLFALIKTAREVARSLNPEPVVRRPWQTALLRMLNSPEVYGRFSSANILLEAIRWLHPIQHTIVQVPELAEGVPGNKRQLIPVEPVLTSKRIRRILEHPSMVRLKRVPQMPMASSVFPGANHTRYEHSMGTFENMRRIILALMDDEEFLSIFNTELVELALLSALLSNLTRYPFHSVVSEIRNTDNNLFPALAHTSLLKEIFEDEYKSHGSLKQWISRSFPSIKYERVVSMLAGRPMRFNDPGFRIIYYMLNSSIDVRVLDYLQRDPLHTGTSKGEFFDLGELLNHIKIHNDQVVVASPGIPVVEQIVATRYWLYGRVYWNKPNRATIAMLRNAIGAIACECPDFGEDLRKELFSPQTTERTLISFMENYAKKNKLGHQQEILELLSGDLPVRYQEIWQFNRAEDEAFATTICERLSEYNLTQMRSLQSNIDSEIIASHSQPTDRAHVLIDLPVESPPHKFGEDINVLTHNGHTVPLNKLSDVVKGSQSGFKEHLQRVRIFLHPKTYDSLLPQKDAIILLIRKHLEGL